MGALHAISASLALVAMPLGESAPDDALRERPDPLITPADTNVTDAAEALFESLTEEAVAADPSDLLELLEDLAGSPLDVNTATVDDLANIPVLSPRMAAAIVDHRDDHGRFGSLRELHRVDGITAEMIYEARPYLTIGDAPLPQARPRRFHSVPRLAEMRRQARVTLLQRVQRRLDLPRGFDPVPDSLIGTPDEPRRYLGSPERLYTRVRATYRRNFSANLTLEKDPGEPFTWDPENGFYGYDFVSFHAAAMQVGRIDALVVGDFVAEFGQGLTLWRASGFGKGRETVRPLVRRGRGVRPYGSTDENRFFRGVAATVAVTPQVYASGFVSRRRYDARFAESDTSGVDPGGSGAVVAGMPQTGLHRTHLEIAQKNTLGQTLAGGGVEVRRRRATAGIVGYRALFDDPLGRGDRPYQRFDFEGNQATMLSLYGHAFVGAYDLFAEVARGPGGTIGAVGGIEGDLGPLNALLLVRHYPRDFSSLHGYGFGERNGVGQNETGVYLGMILRPAPRWTVTGYFDQFRSSWLRFAIPRPSTGHDALLFVEHRPRRWLSAYLQARAKSREIGTRITTPTGGEMEALTTETRQSLRFQGEYVASRDVRLRARIEGSRYRRAGEPIETGVALFHDLRWSITRHVLLDARLTYFDTDGFGARLFQFENDLLGVMTNTLLFGRGTRVYALLTLRPGGRLDGLDARIKFAATEYRDRHDIGSGLDQIQGNRVRDIGLQVRYRFGGR